MLTSRLVSRSLLTLGLGSFWIASGTVLAKSSREVRSEKTVGVSARGGIINEMLGKSFEVYYLQTANLQLGLTYSDSYMNDDESSSWAGYDVKTKRVELGEYKRGYEMKSDQVGLFGRYFLLNSFAVKAGIVQRRLTVNFWNLGDAPPNRPEKNVSSKQIDGGITGRSLAAILAVGNHWSFDNGITIGGEWIGHSIPFAALSTRGSYEGVDDVNLPDDESYRQTARNVNRKPLLSALLLDLAYQF